MLDKLIVIQTGKTSMKFIEDNAEQAEVTPFVGHMSQQLGVGIFLPDDNGHLWGLLSPHQLIRSWRAMKLLEVVPRIYTRSTLCRCWYLADEDLGYVEFQHLDDASLLYGSREELQKARAEVIAMFPSEDELDLMLAIANANHIQINHREIAREKKRLSPASEVFLKLRAADEKRAEQLREQRLAEEKRLIVAKEPTAPKRKSLFRRWFF